MDLYNENSRVPEEEATAEAPVGEAASKEKGGQEAPTREAAGEEEATAKAPAGEAAGKEAGGEGALKKEAGLTREEAELIERLKPDAGKVWAQVEEKLAPMLRMDAFERALYYYLLQEGVLRGARKPVRMTHTILRTVTGGRQGFSAWRRLQALCAKGCARIRRGDERSSWVEVNTPEEILERLEDSERAPGGRGDAASPARDQSIRTAIHKREGGRCFYCLQYVRRDYITMDHVVPVSRGGADTLRNLVACCYECNFTKWTQPAADYLRLLYRRNLLTKYEVHLAVKRLKELAAGKLKVWAKPRTGKGRKKETSAGGNEGVWTSARMV